MYGEILSFTAEAQQALVQHNSSRVCEKHSLKSSCSSSYEQNYLNQRWPFSLHFRDCKFRAWLHIRKGLHCGSPMLPHGSWCAAAGCMEQLPRNSPIFHFYIVFFFFASVSPIFKTNPSGNLNTTRFGVIQHLRQGTRYAFASAREEKFCFRHSEPNILGFA